MGFLELSAGRLSSSIGALSSRLWQSAEKKEERERQYLQDPSMKGSLVTEAFSADLRTGTTRKMRYRIGKERAELSVVLVPADDSQEVTVLLADGTRKEDVRRQIQNQDLTFLTNGIFFGAKGSMGDVAGYKLSDPSRRIICQFYQPAEAIRNNIGNRYYFGVDAKGEPHIERCRAGSDRDLSRFISFIGGLAALDLTDPYVLQSLVQNKPSQFQSLFNDYNGVFNGNPAYSGLCGSARDRRTAVGIIRRKGHATVVAMSVEDGASPERGVSIFEFAKAFVRIARQERATPEKLALLSDGRSGLRAATGSPAEDDPSPKAFIGIRPKLRLLKGGKTISSRAG